jgi:hypothetical protein
VGMCGLRGGRGKLGKPINTERQEPLLIRSVGILSKYALPAICDPFGSPQAPAP